MTAQTFTLPWPISTNSMWRAYKGRNILSAKMRDWAATATQELALQKPKAMTGPVEILIKLSPPDKRAFDIDNRVKCLLDLLEHCQVIENDNCHIVKRVCVELGEGLVGAQVTVAPFKAN